MPQSANKLLAALPRRDYQRLRPLLRTLDLSAETGLPHCGHTRVYFPGTGLCSIISKMADGSGIEVACIGNEGVVGLNALTGESPEERNGFVQVGRRTVEYLPAVLFERELARNGRFREVVDQVLPFVSRDGDSGSRVQPPAYDGGAVLQVAAERARPHRARPVRVEGAVSGSRDGRQEFRGRRDFFVAGRPGAGDPRWRVDHHPRRRSGCAGRRAAATRAMKRAYAPAGRS